MAKKAKKSAVKKSAKKSVKKAAKKSAKKSSKKSGTSRMSMISSRAKEIRKTNPSKKWVACIKMASDQLKKEGKM